VVGVTSGRVSGGQCMPISITPDGSCIVSADDMKGSSYTVQKTYRLLKDKGAPIIGGCVLLLDPRYRWFVFDDTSKKHTEFRWEYREE